MKRGAKPGVSKRRPGIKMGTCGHCPCCIARAAYMTRMQKRHKASMEVSDEELDRRALAKPLR